MDVYIVPVICGFGNRILMNSFSTETEKKKEIIIKIHNATSTLMASSLQPTINKVI